MWLPWRGFTSEETLADKVGMHAELERPLRDVAVCIAGPFSRLSQVTLHSISERVLWPLRADALVFVALPAPATLERVGASASPSQSRKVHLRQKTDAWKVVALLRNVLDEELLKEALLQSDPS